MKVAPSPEPELRRLGPIYKTPLLHRSLQYLTQTALEALSRSVRPSGWRIAYGVNGRIKTIPNARGRFLADPFAFQHEGQSFLFAEECERATGKGQIVAYEVSAHCHRRLGTAIEEPFHLSFPFLFRYLGDIYMVPETKAAGDIRLYRATDFPLRWELAHILISGVKAVDTMIFEQAGKWWMLTTVSEHGACDAELHVFYSESPLGGWRAHSQNPVAFDPQEGRCGGLLRQGDRIYRVAQRRGFARYGTACTLRRIDVLTACRFAETEVQALPGTHHVHAAGDLLVFDYRLTSPLFEPSSLIQMGSRPVAPDMATEAPPLTIYPTAA